MKTSSGFQLIQVSTSESSRIDDAVTLNPLRSGQVRFSIFDLKFAELHALFRVANRRSKNFGQRLCAVFFQRIAKPGDVSRHGNRFATAPTGCELSVRAGLRKQIASCRGRCPLAIVERRGRTTFRIPDHHEPAATDPRPAGPQNRLGESNRDRRVHDVAAALQDLDTRLAGQRMICRDGPLFIDGLGRRCLGSRQQNGSCNNLESHEDTSDSSGKNCPSSFSPGGTIGTPSSRG